MSPSARPAETLRLLEADYCYGSGPITIRVEEVDRTNAIQYDDEPFYLVRGMQLAADGNEVGRREIFVRSRRLPAEDQ